MTARSYKTKLLRGSGMCAIPVPFDPKTVFGKTRAPVKVTVNGYTYRSTIAAMGGPHCIPLRKSHREATGIEGSETVDVRLELDDEKREVEPPADLIKALKAAKVWDGWQKLSYTHRKEHAEAVETAKKPETRARRIESAVRALSQPSKRSG
jgi:bacteriocin resistance YdeI/OmpD-like protein/uncharacterized protein DUF1905